MQCLQCPVNSSLLSPKDFLSTLFLNTLSVRDHISHPYNTTGKIIVLYIFGQQTGRKKFLDQMVRDNPQVYSALNFFMSAIFISFINAVPKYLNSATLSKDLLAVFIV
jgi:hypothetical protein